MTDCPIGRGSRSGYQAGCRCDDCSEDQSTYMTLYRAGHRTGPRKAPAPRPVEDTTWMNDRACRPEDGDLFFPGRGDNDMVRAAKAICAGCPVKAECLEFALRNGEHHGIWGGTSERERRQLRRQRNLRGVA